MHLTVTTAGSAATSGCGSGSCCCVAAFVGAEVASSNSSRVSSTNQAGSRSERGRPKFENTVRMHTLIDLRVLGTFRCAKSVRDPSFSRKSRCRTLFSVAQRSKRAVVASSSTPTDARKYSDVIPLKCVGYLCRPPRYRRKASPIRVEVRAFIRSYLPARQLCTNTYKQRSFARCDIFPGCRNGCFCRE